MKAKGLIISALLLALAVPGVCLAKNNKKHTQRTPDLCELIEEYNYLERFFSDNGFIFPADTSKHYPITSEFGLRTNPVRKRIGGPREKDHLGWDIGIDKKEVYAIANGKVIGKNYTKKGGNSLKIECDDAYIDYFSGKKQKVTYSLLHLNKRFVNIGDRVSKGQKIGKSGNTGITSGAHLHIHVQIGEWYVDPKSIYPNYTYFDKE